MQIITNSEITEALCDVNPTHIAVAYVGIDWREYIDVDKLEEIIISPTLRSNPHAIAQIVEKLGWEHVHFLDPLHAKFYIGESKAAIGSFNLSKNGIGADGLEELGVVTDDMAHIARLHEEFKRLKKMANEKYQNPKAKEKKLKELFKMWKKAIEAGILSGKEKQASPISIKEYINNNYEDIWVMWYVSEAPEIDYGVLGESDLDLRDEKSFKKKTKYWTTVLEKDEIEPRSWVLMWLLGNKGGPDLNKKPYWLYAHQVFNKGVKEKPYTKLLVQREDMCIPPAPFNLNEKGVAEAFKEILSKPEFSMFRKTDENPWSVPSASETKDLINAVKNKIKNQSPTPPANSHPDTN